MAKPTGKRTRQITALVEKFAEHRDVYRRGDYNETQLRRGFLDPLFKALGWDIDNERGYAEAYRDVIHEDALRVEKSVRAPDYCFRVGGVRKFFVEAKKPSVDIQTGVQGPFQLRRYAWTAKLPLSILTDFEEFAVYDCRVKPDKNDKASTARVMLLSFDQYVDRWDEIAGVFSREAILKGSFDKYAESHKKKRGTAEVDEAFLEEIEAWRDALARNLSLRNAAISDRELNFAVQRIIDRIIFLRMCEGRGIEPYGRLQTLLNGEAVYRRLAELFHRADEKYNSGLFHFQREKDREPPDEWTTGLVVDDKVLKEILRRLYYPDSPYEFAALPADILGQVYEQFLGKVIRLTAGHRAKIEEKPEVRTAGGVYYTPTYIVEYIVENTVGKLVEGRSPQEVGGLTATFKRSKKLRPLAVLDPACGSGSFLIVAYQYLLDWYLKQYTENDDPQKHARGASPRDYQTGTGDWRLTTPERKRILLSHIYGVDIDFQAVEVTKLSLLLKALEGETKESVARMLFHKERALPDLAGNIKCGNSLIGPDFYEGKQRELFDESDMLRINAFDWKGKHGFPDVFAGKNPGFDAVIGNPPYGATSSDDQIGYYRQNYQCSKSTVDSFALFIEKGAELLHAGGRFGIIVQSAWVSSPSTETLRKVFATRFKPMAFASMPYDVFGAYIDTVIVVAERLRDGDALGDLESALTELIVFPPRFKIHGLDDFPRFRKTADAVSWLRQGRNEFLVTLSDAERQIIDKMECVGACFVDVADIQRGVTPFHVTPKPPRTNPAQAFTGTVRRYRLTPREQGFIRFDETLAEYKPERYFRGPRLLLRELISRQMQLQAVFTDGDFITNKSMQSILLADNRYHMFYLLGLLYSKLLSWCFLAVQSVGRRDDFPKIVLKQTRELPLQPIDFSNPGDKDSHDRMVNLVQRMLDLHARQPQARTDHERTALSRQIEHTDAQIDRLVYELYGLTEEDVALVEAATVR